MTTPRPGPAGRPDAAAWRALFLLTLVSLLNFYDRLLVAVVSQPLRLEFGLTDTQYGLLTGPAFVVLYVVGNVLFGWLADRHKRKYVMAAALAIWSGMTAVSGMAGSFAMLALGRGGMGIGEGGSNPAGVSLLSDHFPPEKRSMALSIFVAGGMFGLFLSFVLGSWIATQFGWRTAFLMAGIPGLILAAVLLPLVKEPMRGRFDAAPPRKLSYLATLKLLKGNRAFMWLCLAPAMGTFASLGMLIWLPQFFIRNHGLSTQEVGFLFGPAAALGLTLGVLIGGAIGDRLSKRSLASPILVCVFANLGLIPLNLVVLWTPFLPLALGCTFVAMASVAAFSGVVYAAMQNVAPLETRASAAAIFSIVIAVIGQGLAPYVVGVVSDALNPLLGDQALRWSLSVMGSLYSATAFAFFVLAFFSAKAHFNSLGRQTAAA